MSGGHGGGFSPPQPLVNAAWYVGGAIVLIWIIGAAVPWATTEFACMLNSDGEYCTSRRAESAARRADMLGSPFSVERELNRRGGGRQAGSPVRRPVLGRQGLMPSVDCAAMGGIRTTNPNTGMPSCFVPN